MKFSDKLYVGFQRERYMSSDEPRLLGFAVPYGETKADKNRMASVDSWAKRGRDSVDDSRIIDNVPMRGFKILEVVSRYSTSNKLFRVMDPRGFELEISAQNLLDLALKGTIVRGEVVEECVWTHNNGVYLLPTNSDEYKFSLKPKGTVEKGGYYTSVGNLLSVFRFEGFYYRTHLVIEHVPIKARKDGVVTTDTWGIPYGRLLLTEYNTNVVIKLDDKPSYIYTEFILDHEGKLDRKVIHVRKSHFKNLESYDTRKLNREILEYIPDLTQWVDCASPLYERMKDTNIFGAKGSYIGFFSSKEDAKKFDYNPVICTIRGEIKYFEDLSHGSIIKLADSHPRCRSYDIVMANDVVQNYHTTDKR